jgi:hypothetical protein
VALGYVGNQGVFIDVSAVKAGCASTKIVEPSTPQLYQCHQITDTQEQAKNPVIGALENISPSAHRAST